MVSLRSSPSATAVIDVSRAVSEDTKHWQAGYELGQELNNRDNKQPVKEVIQTEADAPLCLMDTLDGKKGDDAQDETDKSAE